MKKFLKTLKRLADILVMCNVNINEVRQYTSGPVAQQVEHQTENLGVGSSILPGTTIKERKRYYAKNDIRNH